MSEGRAVGGRALAAGAAGILFLLGWIAGAILLADRLSGAPEAVRFVYFALAGFVWVGPMRWIMLWGAGQRHLFRR